ATCLQDNRRRLDQAATVILSQPLSSLRARARQAALQASRDYLRAAGEPEPDFSPGAGLFLAGHQPELFHAGVWAKNFALGGLARQHGGVALNLIVDTDLAKVTDLKMPAWNTGRDLLETPPQAV